MSRPDSEHDAWLHEALRHAPDAQVAPPASVSELILREAQAKARSAAAPVPAPPESGFAAFWAWLARPSVAAGAAGVMVATLAGVMWWDRPFDDVRNEPIPATAPAPEDKAAETSPPIIADTMKSKTPGPVIAPAAGPPEQAAAQPEQAAKRAAGSAKEAARDAPPPPRPATTAPPKLEAAAQARPFPATPTDRTPTGGTAAAADSPRDVAVAKSMAPPPAPAIVAAAPPAPSPAPAPAMAAPPPATLSVSPAAAPALQRERAEAASLSGGIVAQRADSATSADARTAPAAAAAPRLTEAPSSQFSRQAAGNAELRKSANALGNAAPPSNIATLRQALAAEPRRWTWQRGGASPQPVNPRLRNWLAQADSAAGTGWHRAPLATPGGEQRDALASSASRELRLLRDGKLVATLRLDGSMLRWESSATDGRAASALQAPLDENAVQGLEQSFP